MAGLQKELIKLGAQGFSVGSDLGTLGITQLGRVLDSQCLSLLEQAGFSRSEKHCHLAFLEGCQYGSTSFVWLLSCTEAAGAQPGRELRSCVLSCHCQSTVCLLPSSRPTCFARLSHTSEDLELERNQLRSGALKLRGESAYEEGLGDSGRTGCKPI